jgi:hypothetical protein
MVDESQLVDDAVAALSEISLAYRGEPLGSLASQLRINSRLKWLSTRIITSESASMR